MSQTISDEILGALLDDEIEGPLKTELVEKIGSDSELLARYLALTELRRKLKSTAVAIEDYNEIRIGQNQLVAKVHMKKPNWSNLLMMLAACIALSGSLGFLAGSVTTSERQADLSSTWIFRATGAHQLSNVDYAWTNVKSVAEIPAVFSPLLNEYHGDLALRSLGYELQGWRAASDGHDPVAVQLVYRNTEGSVATAFIREHVEGRQSSMPIVINGVPAYFTGQNNIDTALIGHDLPFEDVDWQAVVQSAV